MIEEMKEIIKFEMKNYSDEDDAKFIVEYGVELYEWLREHSWLNGE